MEMTYEAETDEYGVIRLSDLIRFPKRRVLVTILDEKQNDVSPKSKNKRLIAELLAEAEVNDEQLSPITTIADLFEHGFGFWSHRDDIDDSVDYAQELRRKNWQRYEL